MDASAIIALVGSALVVGGGVLGGAWALANRIGEVTVSVREVSTKVEAHSVQLTRIELEAHERSHTLSGVRDRLAKLEGSLGVGQ